MTHKPVRVAVITAPNAISAEQQIKQVADSADLIELRLDYWSTIDISAVAELRQKISLPTIFTLRKSSHGGACVLPETKRLSLLQQLAELSPQYLDIEWDVSQACIETLRRQYPHIQLIGSYHDFDHTPDDLDALLLKLMNPLFDIIKIAVFARTICDSLRLLIFLQNASQKQRLIGVAMGEYGEISRVLAPILGSLFTYGCISAHAPTAPGQLTLAELTEIYRVHMHNSSTAMYALIGDPISQSPGHSVHNQAFSNLHQNAVYVKCRVQADMLTQAMTLFRKLPFAGFSVTIPHKETIVPLLDELKGEAVVMRIVNTVKREGNLYWGLNTDASGAASILEERTSLKNKHVLILGGGGSAKAIAYILLEKGAYITLCNRSLSRAVAFTQKFGGKSLHFSELIATKAFPYDIVINTLPVEAFTQQCEKWVMPVHSQGIAMDINLKPLQTPFIQSAKMAGWSCLTGDLLFRAQAVRQLDIWF